MNTIILVNSKRLKNVIGINLDEYNNIGNSKRLKNIIGINLDEYNYSGK